MGLIVSGVGGPRANSSANGGKVYAYNSISTAPGLVIGPNPQRQSIMFHNPGTVDLYIYPKFVVNSGSNVALAPFNPAYGGCFILFANGGTLTIEGECNGDWGAFAVSGTINPLTIMESNT